jgi:hypothetical protein
MVVREDVRPRDRDGKDCLGMSGQSVVHGSASQFNLRKEKPAYIGIKNAV